MKVVINSDWGGFSLSDEAIARYHEIKGIPVYPEKDNSYASMEITTFWYIPLEEREENDDRYFTEYDLDRSDPALVQVVEELGERADGGYASMKVVEIPDDVEWYIQEYDGFEWIAEKHRTWR